MLSDGMFDDFFCFVLFCMSTTDSVAVGWGLHMALLTQKCAWSASCHCAFRQVIPVLICGWKEGRLFGGSAALDQCELSGMSSSLSGRGWCQLGAVDYDFAVEDLEKHGKTRDFSTVLLRGPLEFVTHHFSDVVFHQHILPFTDTQSVGAKRKFKTVQPTMRTVTSADRLVEHSLCRMRHVYRK